MTDIVVNTVAKKQRANTFTPPQKKQQQTTTKNKKQHKQTKTPNCIKWTNSSWQNFMSVVVKYTKCTKHKRNQKLYRVSNGNPRQKDLSDEDKSDLRLPGLQSTAMKRPSRWDCPDQSPLWWKTPQMRLPGSKSTVMKDLLDETALIKIHWDERPPSWDCPDQNPLWWKTTKVRLPWSKSTVMKDHPDSTALIKVHHNEKPPRWDCPDERPPWKPHW